MGVGLVLAVVLRLRLRPGLAVLVQPQLLRAAAFEALVVLEGGLAASENSTLVGGNGLLLDRRAGLELLLQQVLALLLAARVQVGLRVL